MMQSWWVDFSVLVPDIPAWIPAIGMLITLFALNVLTVRLFGEVEFWFAIIKIIAVVALIGVSMVLIASSFVSPSGVTASLNHLLDKQGAFPTACSVSLPGFRWRFSHLRAPS